MCLIFHPFDNNNNALFAASVFVSTTSLVVGSILIVRLVAVYPPSKLSWPALCVVYGPPIVLKIARAVNCGVFLHWLWVHIKRDGLQAGEVAWHLPSSKAEFVMQMVDNSCVQYHVLCSVVPELMCALCAGICQLCFYGSYGRRHAQWHRAPPSEWEVSPSFHSL